MTLKEKEKYCKEFFEKLAEKLKDTHVIVSSCNQDESKYLVPKGTEDQITYYGKPENSFRISDHWNWYSNVKKNKNVDYIQCYNVDLGVKAKKRKAPGLSSEPYFAWCVCIFNDGCYHTMVGEFYSERFDEQVFLQMEDESFEPWIEEWIKNNMH